MKAVGVTKISMRNTIEAQSIETRSDVPVVRLDSGCSSANFQRACSACFFATM